MQSNLLQQRISLVCDYINQHLDDELTVSLLSDVAALSKFHFHRVFVAFMGVNVGKYILLARLKRASFRLAFERDIKIIDIALEAKFDSAEAFSRAFKRTFEQSPSKFRQAANWPSWYDVFNFSPQNLGVQTMQVEIINFEQTQIAFLEHKGSAKQILKVQASLSLGAKIAGFRHSIRVEHLACQMATQKPWLKTHFVLNYVVQ